MNANWRTLIPSREPAYMVKGSEIESIVPDGFRSRFAIYAVRCYVPNPAWQPWSIAEPMQFADTCYHVRDAGLISDADVRAGKRCPIIGHFATFDMALASIEHHRVTDDDN